MEKRLQVEAYSLAFLTRLLLFSLSSKSAKIGIILCGEMVCVSMITKVIYLSVSEISPENLTLLGFEFRPVYFLPTKFSSHCQFPMQDDVASTAFDADDDLFTLVPFHRAITCAAFHTALGVHTMMVVLLNLLLILKELCLRIEEME